MTQRASGRAFEVREIAERLRTAARLRKISLIEVSERADVPYQTLLSYMSGKHMMPISALAAITDVLDIDAEWALRGRRRTTPGVPIDPAHLSAEALEIAALFDAALHCKQTAG